MYQRGARGDAGLPPCTRLLTVAWWKEQPRRGKEPGSASKCLTRDRRAGERRWPPAPQSPGSVCPRSSAPRRRGPGWGCRGIERRASLGTFINSALLLVKNNNHKKGFFFFPVTFFNRKHINFSLFFSQFGFFFFLIPLQLFA